MFAYDDKFGGEEQSCRCTLVQNKNTLCSNLSAIFVVLAIVMFAYDDKFGGEEQSCHCTPVQNKNTLSSNLSAIFVILAIVMLAYDDKFGGEEQSCRLYPGTKRKQKVLLRFCSQCLKVVYFASFDHRHRT
jgi:hypothetical protein